jgi:hypothetical protein
MAMQRLRESAEKAKCELSSAVEVSKVSFLKLFLVLDRNQPSLRHHGQVWSETFAHQVVALQVRVAGR